MTSQDCAHCGFMNVATDHTCFKCGAPLTPARVDSTSQPYFPPPSHGLMSIWRNKSLLVMTKEAQLPSRCVKCNAPAAGTLKRKLTWHHPALYILAFGALLLYAVIAMVVRKTATIHVGLCETHTAARKRDILITWALGLLSLVSFVIAALMEDVTFLLVGALLLFAAPIYYTVKVTVVTPAKIDDHFVWLNGVNSRYLQEFPEWRGVR